MLFELLQLRETGRGSGAQHGRFRNHKRLVEILQVVDRRVERRRRVDAHGYRVRQRVQVSDLGEGGHVRAALAAHLGAPGLDVAVLGNGLVGGVGEGKHFGDVGAENGPERQHVLGVGVVAVFGAARKTLGRVGEPAPSEVVGHVLADKVVRVVGVPDEGVALLGRDADYVDDYLGHQSRAGGGVDGEGFVPVWGEEAVDGVFHG